MMRPAGGKAIASRVAAIAVSVAVSVRVSARVSLVALMVGPVAGTGGVGMVAVGLAASALAPSALAQDGLPPPPPPMLPGNIPIPDDIPIDTLPDYRARMREIVLNLSDYAKGKNPEFIILVRGGAELFEKGQREADLEEMRDPTGRDAHRRLPRGAMMRRFVRAVDGLVLDDAFCGQALAEAEARKAAEAKAKAEAEAAKRAEAKAAADARAAARRRPGEQVVPRSDVIASPGAGSQMVNSLVAEAEAARARAEQEKAKAERQQQGNLTDRIRKEGVRILSLEHCANANQVGYAMKRAIDSGTLSYAVPDPSRRLAVIPRGRPFGENAANVQGLRGARNLLAVFDSSSFASREEFVHAIGETNHDLLLIDGFHRGTQSLTFTEANHLRFKRLGARRLLVARLDIGNAHDDRIYWRRDWQPGTPEWLETPLPGFRGAVVRYWTDDWKALIGPYFQGLVELGVDGVMLEGLDAYRLFEDREPIN